MKRDSSCNSDKSDKYNNFDINVLPSLSPRECRQLVHKVNEKLIPNIRRNFKQLLAYDARQLVDEIRDKYFKNITTFSIDPFVELGVFLLILGIEPNFYDAFCRKIDFKYIFPLINFFKDVFMTHDFTTKELKPKILDPYKNFKNIIDPFKAESFVIKYPYNSSLSIEQLSYMIRNAIKSIKKKTPDDLIIDFEISIKSLISSYIHFPKCDIFIPSATERNEDLNITGDDVHTSDVDSILSDPDGLRNYGINIIEIEPQSFLDDMVKHSLLDKNKSKKKKENGDLQLGDTIRGVNRLSSRVNTALDAFDKVLPEHNTTNFLTQMLDNLNINKHVESLSDKLEGVSKNFDSTATSVAEHLRTTLFVVIGVAAGITLMGDPYSRSKQLIFIGAISTLLIVGNMSFTKEVVNKIKSLLPSEEEIEPQSFSADNIASLCSMIMMGFMASTYDSENIVRKVFQDFGGFGRAKMGMTEACTSAISIFENIINLIKVDCMKGDRIFLGSSSFEETKIIIQAMDAIINKSKQNDLSFDIDDLTFVKLTHTRAKDILRKVNSHLPQNLSRELNSAVVKLENLMDKTGTRISRPTRYRQEPVSIMLHGGPGCGKTQTLKALSNSLCSATLPDRLYQSFLLTPSAYIYGRDPACVFWDAWLNGTHVVEQDDFGQCRDIAGNPDNEYMAWIRLMNPSEYMLHQADLSDKGKDFAEPSFVTATTNVKTFTPESIISADALNRRINMNLCVTIKKQYCTLDTKDNADYYNRKLDVSLLPGGIFDFNVQEFYYCDSFGQVISEAMSFDNVVEKALDLYKQKKQWHSDLLFKTIPLAIDVGSKYRQKVSTFDPTVTAIVLEVEAQGKSENSIASFKLEDKVEEEFEAKIRCFKVRLLDILTTTTHKGFEFWQYKFAWLVRVHQHALYNMLVYKNSGIDELAILASYYMRYMFVLPHSSIETEKVLQNLQNKPDKSLFKLLLIIWDKCDGITQQQFLNILHKTDINKDFANLVFEQYEIIKDMTPAGTYETKSSLMHDFSSFVTRQIRSFECTRLGFFLVQSFRFIDNYKMYILPILGILSIGTMISRSSSKMTKKIDEVMDVSVDTYVLGTEIKGEVICDQRIAINNAKKLDGIAEVVTTSTPQSFGFSDKMKKPKGPVKNKPMPIVTRAAEPQNVTDDPCGVAIMYKIVDRNIYLLKVVTPEGEHISSLGYILGIKGTIFLMPRHYWLRYKLLKQRVEGEVYIVASRPHKNPTDKEQFEYKISASMFEEGVKEFDALNIRDLCVLQFPVWCMKVADITDYFATVATHAQFEPRATFNACLPVFRSGRAVYLDTKSARKCSQSFMARAVSGELEMPYEINHTYIYDLQTTKGDCCSPLFILDKHKNKEKIFALHVGLGNQVFGIGAIITREDIEGILDLVPQVEMLISPEGFDDEVSIIPNAQDHISSCNNTMILEGDLLIASPHEQRKTRIIRSPWHNSPYLKPHEALTGTAQLNIVEGVDPLSIAMNKYCRNTVLLNPYICGKVMDSYANFYYNNRMHKTVKNLLTTIEVLEGDELSDHLCGMNSSSSSGFPMNTSNALDIKKMYFQSSRKEEAFEIIDRKIKEIDVLLAQGKVPSWYFSDCLKDERRPIEKIKSLSTRAFGAGPFMYYCMIRKYFGRFVEEFVANRILNGSAIGVNPYSTDWFNIAFTLSKFTPVFDINQILVGAGDQSGYDGALLPILMNEIKRFIQDWYNDDYALQRSVLWHPLMYSKHIAKGKVYQWIGSLPSGHALTIIVNTIYNHLCHRYCYFLLFMTVSDFDQNVVVIAGGDDSVFSVSEKLRQYFNEITIGPLMAQLGMTYTTETKNVASLAFRPLACVEFLKRTWRQRKVDGYILAPLRFTVIMEIPMWTKKKDVAHSIFFSNINEALRELTLWDDDNSKKVYQTIQRSFELDFPEYNLTDLWLDYQSRQDEVLNTSLFF